MKIFLVLFFFKLSTVCLQKVIQQSSAFYWIIKKNFVWFFISSLFIVSFELFSYRCQGEQKLFVVFHSLSTRLCESVQQKLYFVWFRSMITFPILRWSINQSKRWNSEHLYFYNFSWNASSSMETKKKVVPRQAELSRQKKTLNYNMSYELAYPYSG